MFPVRAVRWLMAEGGVSDSEELEVLGLGASSSTSVTLLSI